MKKKIRLSFGKKVESKILCVAMAFLIGTTIINPNFISSAFAEQKELQTSFEEILSEDKLSSNIKLMIRENEKQSIISVVLPDGSVIPKENLIEENGNTYIEYVADKNTELNFVVQYEEKQSNDTATENIESTEPLNDSEMKAETLTYVVSDIKSIDDMELKIVAQDLEYTIGDEINLLEGIEIKDENDVLVTDNVTINISNENEINKSKEGVYNVIYSVAHPVSNKEFTFTRKVTLKANEETGDKSNSEENSQSNSNKVSQYSLSDIVDKTIYFEDFETIETFEYSTTYQMMGKKYSVPEYIQLNGKAYYVDNDGNKVSIKGFYDIGVVNTKTIGKTVATYRYDNPFTGKPETKEQMILVHGNLTIIPPKDDVFYVHKGIFEMDYMYGTFDFFATYTYNYTHVKEDGTTEIRSGSCDVADRYIEHTPKEYLTEKITGMASIKILDKTYTKYFGSKVVVKEFPQLEVDKEDITVKAGESIENIKKIINAEAYNIYLSGALGTIETKVDLEVDWSELERIDTSKEGVVYHFKLHATEPENNDSVSKEITLRISTKAKFSFPDVNKVVGDSFDPLEGVSVKDAQGNTIDLSNVNVNTDAVDMSKQGVYKVIYSYIDTNGNETIASNNVKVNSQLKIDDIDKSVTLLQKLMIYTPKQLTAYYYDYNNNRIQVNYQSLENNVIPFLVGKYDVKYQFKHPVNGEIINEKQDVYVQGRVKIKVPETKIAKVNDSIDPLEGVTASYSYVDKNGKIEDKEVMAITSTENPLTSSVIGKVNIPVSASVNLDGIENSSVASYDIVFNGIPEIEVSNPEITVGVNSSFEQIKGILDASASVRYADESEPMDLTNKIDWSEVKLIDTNKKNETYTVKIHVTDKDGYTADKELKIKISDEIIANLPVVNKVVGEKFDPMKDVTIIDGSGNIVDMKEVSINSQVDMNTPGNYDVTYKYTDSLGNKIDVKNTIHVHGDLEFEGLDRVDLIRTNNTVYTPNTGKAYYVSSNGEKVYVDVAYVNNVDQSNIGLRDVELKAVHPVNYQIKTTNQKIFVHGEIVFVKPAMTTAKIGQYLDPSKGVQASFKMVNDDRTISSKNVDVSPVKGNMTSKTPGYALGDIEAIGHVGNLTISGKESVQAAFDGYPYINSASYITIDAGSISLNELKVLINASAGMSRADGSTLILRDDIEFIDLNKVDLEKAGMYTILLRVEDPTGESASKRVVIEVNDKTSVVIPDDNITPNPVPVTPETPTVPEVTETPEDNNVNTVTTVDNTDNVEDSYVVISKDIPLSVTENGITDELVKSYIYATSELKGVVDFDILSHTVKPSVGTYEATVRFSDGTVKTVRINVTDDKVQDAQKPEFGREEECFIHWIILLLLLGYSVYSITVILKRHHEIKELEEALNSSNSKKEKMMTKKGEE